jgi:hypothetical protein
MSISRFGPTPSSQPPRLPPPACHPFNLPLPLSSCPRDAARRGLLDLLDSVRGRKALVLEAGFAAPLGLIADALTLKEHGVEV